MGSKNKLKRFNENENFHNVIQPTREEVVDQKLALKETGIKHFLKMKTLLF